MKKLAFTLLVLGLVMNAWLWNRVAGLQREIQTRAASGDEAEQLRQQLRDWEEKSRAKISPQPASSDAIELARLRNEVGQLRRQVEETKKAPAPVSWRRLPATADWNEKFAAATNELAEQSQYLDELHSKHALLISNLATASPQDLEDLKRRAQSRQCIQNLKQIGLAARVWANDNGDKFPRDYFTMREELGTPAVLFCPSGPTTIPNDWAQLNPSMISYTWHGATASEENPDSVLTTCPIHGHEGHGDGSVHQTRPGPTIP